MRIHNIRVDKLRPHERTNPKNLAKIKASLLSRGYVKNPVVVDKDHKIILDGHHRVKALHELGYKKIPVILVDYRDSKIIVLSRRKRIKITKKIIIKTVLQNKIFPCKTSKHLIPHRLKNINIPLSRLK